ncbi:hypothetical protein J6590_061493 [Homalodisca vitripennis]|nr:hypothetical protein J6590_061493 [Homalodisca vitripennis]
MVPQHHNKLFKNQRYNCSLRAAGNQCGPTILKADSTLDEVYSSKFLGMYFDRGLTWNVHIDHVCAKICSGL